MTAKVQKIKKEAGGFNLSNGEETVYCDKLIRGTFSMAEYPSIVEQAFDKYRIDRTRMLRYARRRNREKEIAHVLDAGLD